MWSSSIEPAAARGSFRAFKKALVAPCSAEVNNCIRTTRGPTPPLAADRVYDHNGAVPSTVRHAGRPQERPAAEVSAGLLSEKKRPNPALADLAVLAGPWLLLRSRKSVLVRLTRPGCRSSSCQAFRCPTEGVSTGRYRRNRRNRPIPTVVRRHSRHHRCCRHPGSDLRRHRRRSRAWGRVGGPVGLRLG